MLGWGGRAIGHVNIIEDHRCASLRPHKHSFGGRELWVIKSQDAGLAGSGFPVGRDQCSTCV
eukprot:457716-Amphidinium_carterae.1